MYAIRSYYDSNELAHEQAQDHPQGHWLEKVRHREARERDASVGERSYNFV